MTENEQPPEIINVDSAHDFEMDCRMLRIQISMYIALWRESKISDSNHGVSDSYKVEADFQGISKTIGITSDGPDHVNLKILKDGTSEVDYDFHVSGSLQTTFPDGTVIESTLQDAEEYDRLYDAMQNMRLCVDAESDKD